MAATDIFPLSALSNAADHLEIGGCDTTRLAEEFGTPLYVYDELTLRTLATQAQQALVAQWPTTTLLYATKAFFAPFLARLYQELGLGLDVTSEGELEIVRRVDFARDRIYLHGNNKTPSEIRAALALGIDHIVVDNRSEIPLIAAIAAELGVRPRLTLRLSPNIDPHTHRYLTTAHAGSKFGLGISNGEAVRAFREICKHPQLQLVGLHFHLGSQIFEAETYPRGVAGALNVARDWQTRFGFELQELDVGGGWGVAYTEDQEPLPFDWMARTISSALRDGLAERNLPGNCKLVVEPGRALIARAGVALYRIGSIKRISVSHTYAAVDGGMGDNIRPPLYGARYIARLANRFNAEAEHTYSIAGRYCEQGDILIDSIPLPRLNTGDLLVIPAGGAYQLPMASNYNLMPRPAVVLVKDGDARLVRRRETMADLLACDVE
ncbi:MAG: diaminopimelate decarboxylase [Anaerolineae bacterium]